MEVVQVVTVQLVVYIKVREIVVTIVQHVEGIKRVAITAGYILNVILVVQQQMDTDTAEATAIDVEAHMDMVAIRGDIVQVVSGGYAQTVVEPMTLVMENTVLCVRDIGLIQRLAP